MAGKNLDKERDDVRFRDSEPRIHPSARLKDTRLGRYCSIGERVWLHDVTLGDFSYFERQSEAIYTDIGKFCSIAAHVRINALSHPLERPSQHKITYRPNEYFRYLPLDSYFRERRQGQQVHIGHDVWIGHGAVIMPGIRIGHGAVVGANAVVTHHVGNYQIVAGVPACLVRQRFDEPIAARLLQLSWWGWPLTKLYDALPDMQNLDIETFLDKWKPRNM